MRCFALLSLGETMQLVGRPEEARVVLRQAIGLCERKGFSVGAARAQRVLRTT